MAEQPLKIIIKGLGWSGSGAVVSLLQEFNGIQQVPGGPAVVEPTGLVRLGEFNFFRVPGGVGDQLESAPAGPAAGPSGIVAYAKKKSRSARSKTIRNIISGRSPRRTLTALSVYNQIRKINRLSIALDDDLRVLTSRVERLERARRWMNDVTGVVSNSDTRGVIFDQAIRFGAHTSTWSHVFENWRLIIVFRDPRDQIAEQYLHGKIAPINDKGYTVALKQRIDSTMATMRAIDTLLEDAELRTKILLVRFESLIENYAETVHKITEFLGLSTEEHVRRGYYLDTNWSQRNIGIYRDTAVPGLALPMIADLMEWYAQHLD